MRFKKGSKVEVLTEKDMPAGVWRCGLIISGNGHTYSVRFDCLGGDFVERVTRKAIRPCPPPVDGSDGWTAGDVVEVFDEFCWKTAAVLRVMHQNYYLVRVIGSSRELQLNKVYIRFRQLWRDDKWVVIRKDPGRCEDLKSNKRVFLNNHKKRSFQMMQANENLKKQAEEICFDVQNDAGFQESQVLSNTRGLKRASPLSSSDAESYNGEAAKRRAVERKVERQRVITGYQSSFLRKVDAVAYPQKFLGKKYMHRPPHNQTVGYNESKKKIQNYCNEDFHSRSLQPNDSDTDACSVGSCSVVSVSPSILSSRNLAGDSPDADTFSSDAESFYGRGDEEENYFLPLGEDVAAKVHRLELHAYRCTLDALYASGPLSWEQEALLTNLRISLNISNDEHLVELRNLISAGTSTQFS